MYRYGDSSAFVNYFFHTTVGTAYYDSSNHVRSVGDAYITKPWIDSDSALALCENRGGSAFRIANPQCSIQAAVGEAVVPNSHPFWYIRYVPVDPLKVPLAILIDATDSTLSAVEQLPTAPNDPVILYQNYPNPFNPVTSIRFTIRDPAFVHLDIFNLLGQQVSSLISRRMSSGPVVVQWDASRQASGPYIYRLQVDRVVKSGQMIFLK
jgi:hypothetical protein